MTFSSIEDSLVHSCAQVMQRDTPRASTFLVNKRDCPGLEGHDACVQHGSPTA